MGIRGQKSTSLLAALDQRMWFGLWPDRIPASFLQERPGLPMGLQRGQLAWPHKRRIVASFFQVMAVKREGSEQGSGTGT